MDNHQSTRYLCGSLPLGMLVLVASATIAQEKGPELKAEFHQSFRGGDPRNPNLRPIREDNFRWEAAGARITLPAGQGKLPTTGIAANFKIKGDFEITVSYEVLNAEQPSEGYGVGVSMFVAIVPETMDAVSLARRIPRKGPAVFMSDRMKPEETKVNHVVKTMPSKAPAGRLRIQRSGSMVRFLVAEGDNTDFVPINQGDAKDLMPEVEFGADEIRYFQVGGDAGDSQSALDLRLFDLSVRAEELPNLIELPLRKQQAPSGTPPVASSHGPGIVLILGLTAAGLLAIGACAWLFFRRHRATSVPQLETRSPEKAEPAMLAGTIVTSCAKCRMKLKVNAKLAGRHVKCPNCNDKVLVPPQ